MCRAVLAFEHGRLSVPPALAVRSPAIGAASPAATAAAAAAAATAVRAKQIPCITCLLPRLRSSGGRAANTARAVLRCTARPQPQQCLAHAVRLVQVVLQPLPLALHGQRLGVNGGLQRCGCARLLYQRPVALPKHAVDLAADRAVALWHACDTVELW